MSHVIHGFGRFYLRWIEKNVTRTIDCMKESQFFNLKIKRKRKNPQKIKIKERIPVLQHHMAKF
jgi:hypothetical protein